MIVACLMQACHSFDTSDPNVKCFSQKAGRADCNLAFPKILYEEASVLDIREKTVDRISGNCVVSPLPFFLCQTKDVVEAGFKKLLSLCGDSSGTYTTPNAEAIKFIVRGRLPPPTIEDDAPFLKPQCISKSKKAVNLDDCAAAYSQLPVDATGNFLDDSIPRGIPTSINSRTLKTCTVRF
ncbi:hypothetical protein MJO29_005229 [Puccinia striiformis f. sp. tritici]|nr:hypothetical protein MJO29_005229 [Puccinia striiformis f. sp. tritici]